MKKITIFMTAMLMVSAASVQADIVGLWHLDGDTTDSSGYGNDGTIFGDSCFVDGMFDQALRFDGDEDYVLLNNSNIILNTGTFTIEAWFKTSINHGVYGYNPPDGPMEGRLVNLARDSGGNQYTAVALYFEKNVTPHSSAMVSCRRHGDV